MLTNNLARQFINPKTNTMKKLSRLLLRPALITCIAAGIISCGKDDPAPRITVAFSGTSMTVSENDGTVTVDVELNQPYGKDLNIEYSVSGTASDQDNVGTAAADFQIEGTHGVVSIPAGSTEGTINITIMNDNIYEENETIVLRIIDTNTGDVQIGDASEFVITITSDDPQLTASFAAATMTINEDDDFEGLIQVVVQLDKPAPTDLKLSYTIDGNALDSLTGHNENIPPMYYDYHIHGVAGELEIPAGETSAAIELWVYTDLLFEDDEIIEFTLQPSPGIAIGERASIEITVLQQNGKVIALVWSDEAAAQGVDMDLFLWSGPDAENLALSALSATAGTDVEIVFLPYILTDAMEDFTFGMSYNYYDGNADPLDFEVHFADFVDGEVEGIGDRDIFTATYTAANRFQWTAANLPAIVQTFRIVNGEYTDFSEIMVPASGSRTRTLSGPSYLKRQSTIRPRAFK